MGSLPIGISGSRAAAILGMSPWATPFSVWQDIMEKLHPNKGGKGFNQSRGYDYTPFEGNASTRWGLAFEDAVIKLAEEKYKDGTYQITDREREFKLGEHGSNKLHDGPDYITCHIDGMYQFNPRVLHEGKTTTAFGMDKWGEPGSDRIPVEYQIQTQHQMLCTGADSAIVSVLVFPKRPEEWEAEGLTASDKALCIDKHGVPHVEHHGNYAIYKDDRVFGNITDWALTLSQMGFFHQYVVKSDPDLQALMLDKYREWWDLWVIGETAPPVANYADIRAMITAPTGTIIVDDHTARWFKERKDINAEIGKTGSAAKKADQLKVMILDHARGLEATLDDDSTDKWLFMDGKGQKLGSYGRTKKGTMVFR